MSDGGLKATALRLRTVGSRRRRTGDDGRHGEENEWNAKSGEYAEIWREMEIESGCGVAEGWLLGREEWRMGDKRWRACRMINDAAGKRDAGRDAHDTCFFNFTALGIRA